MIDLVGIYVQLRTTQNTPMKYESVHLTIITLVILVTLCNICVSVLNGGLRVVTRVIIYIHAPFAIVLLIYDCYHKFTRRQKINSFTIVFAEE